jgi:flagellar basal body-associated protein FliL
MKNFVKKIQEKPRSTRVVILWLLTVIVMFVVAAVWVFSFSKTSKKTKDEIDQTGFPSLFKSIEKDFNMFKQGLEANINDLKNISNEEEQQ